MVPLLAAIPAAMARMIMILHQRMIPSKGNNEDDSNNNNTRTTTLDPTAAPVPDRFLPQKDTANYWTTTIIIVIIIMDT